MRGRGRNGQPAEVFELELKTLTPVLGGSPELRKVDSEDTIRVPTIRGHLRFWWRALYGHLHQSAGELARAERALWGGMGAAGEEAVRSPVEVRVSQVRRTSIEDKDPAGAGLYALWPARKETKRQLPPAQRWSPGLRFHLEVRLPEALELPGPVGLESSEQVKAALRAWLLFGGYGSRTRRGCGSLTVEGSAEQVAQWLPRRASAEELRRLGVWPVAPADGASARAELVDMPVLWGARLAWLPLESREPQKAWEQALKSLFDFRQGDGIDRSKGPESRGERRLPPRAPQWGGRAQPQSLQVPDKQLARKRGDRERPGPSRWPEADVIRLLVEQDLKRRKQKIEPWAHPPRPEHMGEVLWPRAALGLPLTFGFQTKARGHQGKPYHEPERHQLLWEDGQGVPHDRLASPLIVKPLPLANGSCVPMVLWLSRGAPQGKVVLVPLKDTSQAGGARPKVPGSEAGFDLPQGERPRLLFPPLRSASSLREAFFSWLREHFTEGKKWQHISSP